MRNASGIEDCEEGENPSPSALTVQLEDALDTDLEPDWYCCLRIHNLSQVFMGFVKHRIFYIELVHILRPFLKDGV